MYRLEDIKVADRRRTMERADRAKQFMPFDALTGFREALREKERKLEEKEQNILTEEGIWVRR